MVLVDANVLLDVLTDDPVWAAWSQAELARAASEGLAINPIIYAELAPAFRSEPELAAALDGWPLQRLALRYGNQKDTCALGDESESLTGLPLSRLSDRLGDRYLERRGQGCGR